MTRSEVNPSIAAVKELMAQEPDALREIVCSVMQAMLEAEMDEAVGAGQGRAQRGAAWRSYGRTLITRVGKLELRVSVRQGLILLTNRKAGHQFRRAGAGRFRDTTLRSGGSPLAGRRQVDSQVLSSPCQSKMPDCA